MTLAAIRAIEDALARQQAVIANQARRLGVANRLIQGLVVASALQQPDPLRYLHAVREIAYDASDPEQEAMREALDRALVLLENAVIARTQGGDVSL